MKDERSVNFCNKCGEKLVLVNRTKSDYDTTTGKRSDIEEYRCPKYNWLGMHTKVKVYYHDKGIIFEEDNLGTIGD